MIALHWGLFFLILSLATVNSEGDIEEVSNLETDQTEDLPRYVVFPGLDADDEEIAEWNIGFASPFNVFFGPKPYVLGWLGEAPFGPIDEEGEEDIEGEEGDLEEGEDGEGELEGEGEEEEDIAPDYEYESVQKQI